MFFGKKVTTLKIYLFPLSNKSEWAVFYSPETPCLHLQLSVHCTVEMDLKTRDIPYGIGEGEVKIGRYPNMFYFSQSNPKWWCSTFKKKKNLNLSLAWARLGLKTLGSLLCWTLSFSEILSLKNTAELCTQRPHWVPIEPLNIAKY